MEEIVRPFQAPAQRPGFRAPSTSGLNSDTPAATIGNMAAVQTDETPFARTDEPEDYGWWPRVNMLLAGMMEIVSEWIPVSSAVTINPNICNVWRLRCQSTSLAISFSALTSPSWINQLLIWAGVVRVSTLEIIIDWQVAASGSRTLTLSSVRFPDGATPVWTPTTGRDVLIVQITSDGERYGFVAGLDVRVPS